MVLLKNQGYSSNGPVVRGVQVANVCVYQVLMVEQAVQAVLVVHQYPWKCPGTSVSYMISPSSRRQRRLPASAVVTPVEAVEVVVLDTSVIVEEPAPVQTYV